MAVLWTILWTAVYLVAVLLCLLILYTLYIYYQRLKYKHIPSPAYKCTGVLSYLFAHAGPLQEKYKRKELFMTILHDWIMELGDTFVFHSLHYNLVVTVNLNAIKTLVNDGGTPKDEFAYKQFAYLYGQRFLGDSGLVVMIDDQKASKLRSVLNPAFHRKSLASLMDEFNGTGDVLMTRFQTFAEDGSTVDLHDYFLRAALDLIGNVAFGVNLNGITNDDSPFHKAMGKGLEGFQTSSRYIFEKYNPFHYAEHQRVRDALKLMRKTGKGWIRERQKAIEQGDPVPDDILSYIVHARDTLPHLTMEDLIDLFSVFFLAGHETTANVMSFAIREVMRHPDVLEKLQEEVHDVIGEKPSITYDDLGKLQYTNMVIRETMRLYPPVGLTFRNNPTDQLIGGYNVPAKTNVLLSFFTAHRHPDYWNEPLQFKPERFDPNLEERHNTYSYLPFSLGPRNCIGMNLALIETKVFLAKFIQKFTLTFDPSQKFGIIEATTLRPEGGVMCQLHLR